MTLGELIRKRRVEMGVTIQEMADAMQVTRVTIVHIENNKSRKVRLSLVAKMAKYLRLDAADILHAALLLEPSK